MPVQPDRARRGRVPLFPVLGLVVGACATLPVLVGPQLATARTVEIADHLVPGLVVASVSAVMLAMGRSLPVSGVVMLSAGMVISYAAAQFPASG